MKTTVLTEKVSSDHQLHVVAQPQVVVDLNTLAIGQSMYDGFNDDGSNKNLQNATNTSWRATKKKKSKWVPFAARPIA